MHKDIFIDRYKQSDVEKDYKNFVEKIKELKPYIIKFKEYSIIKKKIHPFNYMVYGPSHYLIIVITHDEYTFSINNGIWQA